MAKGANQKLKLLYLIRIFQEKTDDDHGITMQEKGVSTLVSVNLIENDLK